MRGILVRPAVRVLFLLLVLWGVVLPPPCPAQETPNIIKFADYVQFYEQIKNTEDFRRQ